MMHSSWTAYRKYCKCNMISCIPGVAPHLLYFLPFAISSSQKSQRAINKVKDAFQLESFTSYGRCRMISNLLIGMRHLLNFLPLANFREPESRKSLRAIKRVNDALQLKGMKSYSICTMISNIQIGMRHLLYLLPFAISENRKSQKGANRANYAS